MKKIIQQQKLVLLLLLAVYVFITPSCKKETVLFAEGEKTGIYFQKDSITYSFGVTPLEIKTYTLRIPLRIIGQATNTARTFQIGIDAAGTTAQPQVHYDITSDKVLMPDSTNAYIDLKINREALGTSEFKVTINLQPNEQFQPVNENYKKVVVYFNNQVNPPDWKDWTGAPSWPDSQLGPWNPDKYVKFIELFRAMETTAPSTYQDMVAEFGPDLKNVTFGWPWEYNYSMEKHVLIPLYTYFMVEHPELGITVPKPPNY